MSYTIKTTDSFIIKARPSRDADISLLLFTEQFGLLNNATAKSARQIKSKLRYSLQSLSFSSISLVKGREVWRVTSAKKYISLYDRRLPLIYRSLFARLLAFIERFCPRETPEPKIFDQLKQLSSLVFKREAEKAAPSAIFVESLELIFMLKALYELGYVTMTDEIADCVKNPLSEKIIQEIDPLRKEIRKIIEKGMAESHL